MWWKIDSIKTKNAFELNNVVNAKRNETTRYLYESYFNVMKNWFDLQEECDCIKLCLSTNDFSSIEAKKHT